jgi:hypothetical protein
MEMEDGYGKLALRDLPCRAAACARSILSLSDLADLLSLSGGVKLGGKSKTEWFSSSVSTSWRVPGGWTCLLYSMAAV